jgi:hypothetical protein
MPPRLYYWLALGGTATAIGVALIVNHYNTTALVAFMVAFICVATGGMAELLVPFFTWEFSRYGKCDRAVQERIKLGQKLLARPVLDEETWIEWQARTEFVLGRYLGRWNPAFRLLESAGKYQEGYDYTQDDRKILMAKQLKTMMDLRKQLRERDVVVVK